MNGRLVLAAGDVNLTFKRYLRDVVAPSVDDDYVIGIDGEGVDADMMRGYFAAWGEREAYGVSHGGWGMNPRARWDAMVFYDNRDFNGTELRAFPGNFSYSTVKRGRGAAQGLTAPGSGFPAPAAGSAHRRPNHGRPGARSSAQHGCAGCRLRRSDFAVRIMRAVPPAIYRAALDALMNFDPAIAADAPGFSIVGDRDPCGMRGTVSRTLV